MISLMHTVTCIIIQAAGGLTQSTLGVPLWGRGSQLQMGSSDNSEPHGLCPLALNSGSLM